MSQPPSFQITVVFAQEEQNQVSGRSSIRTAALDTLMSAIKSTLDATLGNLRLIQRDDGELLDGIVKTHALSADVLALIANGAFVVRGDWLTTTAYAKGDIAVESAVIYLCIVAHTSGTFATDLAAGKWVQFFTAMAASNSSFAPTAYLDSTSVQDAIEELDEDLRYAVDLYMFNNYGGIR